MVSNTSVRRTFFFLTTPETQGILGNVRWDIEFSKAPRSRLKAQPTTENFFSGSLSRLDSSSKGQNFNPFPGPINQTLLIGKRTKWSSSLRLKQEKIWNCIYLSMDAAVFMTAWTPAAAPPIPDTLENIATSPTIVTTRLHLLQFDVRELA